MSTNPSEYEQGLLAQRRSKLAEIGAIGQRLGLSAAESSYPSRFPSAGEPLTLAHIPDLLQQYDGPTPVTADQLEATKPAVAIAGRLMSHRLQGKAGFAHLQQGGKRLQIYIRRDDVGEDIFALYKLLDLGDHIGVRGTIMRTRTGELTLKAHPIGGQPAISFLAKAILALPDKYHGLEDVELRYRHRYVDLIMNSGTLAKAEPALSRDVSSQPESGPSADAAERPAVLPPGTSAVTDTALPNNEHLDAPRNVREVFVKRAAILRAIRKFFDDRGYLEVETPMMHTVAGGAAARPFKTHHNALDIPLSLRIAPELYLKRLVVGGLDRVYEINRNFRNEGVSTQHNPEFTMLEFYQAYSDYHDLMNLTQEFITEIAIEVNGTTITHFGGQEIDLGKWQRLSMREAIIKFWPEDFGIPLFESDLGTSEALFLKLQLATDGGEEPVSEPEWDEDIAPAGEVSSRLLRQLNLAFYGLQTGAPLGMVIADVFEALAEPHLIQPTIIYDFPLAVSPLSKQKPDEPDWVERFEFYIGGFEVGNAFSELNDPDEQRRRFEAQLAERARGDEEAMAEMDEDYVRALGFGLPPTAGEGIGIDRFTMLLTGSRSIRDVILFPLLRPQGRPTAAGDGRAFLDGEGAELAGSEVVETGADE